MLAVVAAIGLNGCGDDVTVPPPESPPPPPQDLSLSVTVSPQEAEVALGETISFQANVSTGADIEGFSVTWSSSDPDKAEIASTGGSNNTTATVEAKEEGTVSITANVSASNAGTTASDAATLNIVADEEAQPSIDAIDVTPAEVMLEPGQTASITADVETSGGVEGLNVEFESNDPDVASVEKTGDFSAQITAEAEGSAAVTATATADNVEGSRSASVAVEVRTEVEPEIVGVELTPQSTTLDPGQSTTFTADVQTRGDVQGLAVEFSIGDETVATVEKTGDFTARVTAESSGETALTATASADNVDGSQSASSTVTVRQLEDPEVSIGDIVFQQTGNPVDLDDVSGQINVELNVNEGDATIERVELLFNDAAGPDDFEVVSAQDFQRSTTGAGSDQTQSVVLRWPTDQITTKLRPGDLVDRGEDDGTVKTGLSVNGLGVISARLTTEGGETVRAGAEDEQELRLNNRNRAVVSCQTCANGVVSPAGNLYNGGEDETWNVTTVDYTGDGVGSVTLTPTMGTASANPKSGASADLGAGAGVAATDGTAPFGFTATVANNSEAVEDMDAAGGGDGPNVSEDTDGDGMLDPGEDVDGDGQLDTGGAVGHDLIVTRITDGNGVNQDLPNDWFVTSAVDQFLDWVGPDVNNGGASEITVGGADVPDAPASPTWYSQGAGAFGLSNVIEVGVGGISTTFDADDKRTMTDPDYTDVSGPADLAERLASNVQARLASLEDDLGNVTNIDPATGTPVDVAGADGVGTVADNESEGFGTDFVETALTDRLPADGTVFKGDGSDNKHMIIVDIADPPFEDPVAGAGTPASGVDHASVMVTVTDATGTTAGPFGIGDARLTADRDGDGTLGDYALDISGFPDGPLSFSFAAPDNAITPNAGGEAGDLVQDQTAPQFSALDPTPQGSAGTQATSQIQEIGGDVTDANVIVSAIINVRATSSVAGEQYDDGDGTDGVDNNDDTCQMGDELLNPTAEINQNTVDITDGTGSISFDESFEIQEPSSTFTGTVTYCYRIEASDEAVDNMGTADPNTDELNTESEVTWQ